MEIYTDWFDVGSIYMQLLVELGGGGEGGAKNVDICQELLPPTSAVEVINTEPCVCVRPCVCLSVSALMAKPCCIWSRNLVQGLAMIISWTSSKVKVIGQRSRSQGQKTSFSGFSDLSEQISSLGLWCDVMMSHDVMGSRRDVK